ncbi:MAG: threonine synthase [Myxococcales bacterium]|nr:threonine synthase [Myxococcales bacterium]
MRYVSTRGRSPSLPLSEALAASLAPDGGLYVPEELPVLPPPPADRSLPAVARWLLAPFVAGDPLQERLGELCDQAFAFDAPLVPVGEGISVLELFHGPTAAFKDYGARFLAAALSGGEREQTVLVATSGDTGGAVASAFHGLPGTRVVVLYPHGGVSERQAHQLGSFGGNVTTLAVDGSFDDCQAMVKRAFADVELRRRVRLVSANSISLGRWLPQAVYAARAALERPGATFVVPTGNLGDACAALLARDLGLPIGRIVLACNANRPLVDLFEQHVYTPRPSVPTLANAMDVGAPSNLERLLHFHAAPWDADLEAVSVTDDTIRATLATWGGRGVVVCPHTAVGLHAAERHAGPRVVYATAHPGKFDDVVEPILGRPIPLPESLRTMLARDSHATRIPADDAALRNHL